MKFGMLRYTVALYAHALCAMGLQDTLSPDNALIVLRLTHIQARTNIFQKSHIPDHQTVYALLRGIDTTWAEVLTIKGTHRLISSQHYFDQEKRAQDYDTLRKQWSAYNTKHSDYEKYRQRLLTELKNEIAHDALHQEVSSALMFLGNALEEAKDILENTDKKRVVTSQTPQLLLTYAQKKPLCNGGLADQDLLDNWEFIP